MSTGLSMLPWFPGDFMKSTRGWSVTAKGIYRELLDAQWDLGGLPADVDALRELIYATADEWSEEWRRCEPKFPVCEEGQRRNARLEQHREKALGLQASRSRGASQTNAERYGGRDAERSHPSPSPSPSSSSREPPVVPQGGQGRRPRLSTVKPDKFEQQVIDAYHELLPDHPRVEDWTRTRRRHLRDRIAESRVRGEPADRIQFWRKFFEHVSEANWLCGRTSDDDSDPFVAGLPWLLRADNFINVIERWGISHGKGNGQHRGEAYADEVRRGDQVVREWLHRALASVIATSWPRVFREEWAVLTIVACVHFGSAS